jgi:hypothetical protein
LRPDRNVHETQPVSGRHRAKVGMIGNDEGEVGGVVPRPRPQDQVVEAMIGLGDKHGDLGPVGRGRHAGLHAQAGREAMKGGCIR